MHPDLLPIVSLMLPVLMTYHDLEVDLGYPMLSQGSILCLMHVHFATMVPKCCVSFHMHIYGITVDSLAGLAGCILLLHVCPLILWEGTVDLLTWVEHQYVCPEVIKWCYSESTIVWSADFIDLVLGVHVMDERMMKAPQGLSGWSKSARQETARRRQDVVHWSVTTIGSLCKLHAACQRVVITGILVSQSLFADLGLRFSHSADAFRSEGNASEGFCRNSSECFPNTKYHQVQITVHRMDNYWLWL